MDVQAMLVRDLLGRGGEGARLVHGRSRPWASVTFTGARHVLRLAMLAEQEEAFAQGIKESQFALPRHFVADIVIAGRRRADRDVVLDIEVLTIEEH